MLFYKVDYILNLHPNTHKTMILFCTEGLNGFETISRLLNNAAFCLVPHSRPHLSVCSILNIGQCLCVHAILTPGKKRLVSRMTLCLRPVVHESNEVSDSLLDFNNSEGTELYVIIYKERAAKLGLFGRQNTCSSSIACQTFNNLQYLICIGRMFL